MGLSTNYCSLASKDCTGILADGTALLEGHTVPKSLKEEGIRHLQMYYRSHSYKDIKTFAHIGTFPKMFLPKLHVSTLPCN